MTTEAHTPDENPGLHRPFTQGQDARAAGLDRLANPYLPGGLPYRQWVAGYKGKEEPNE